MGFVCHIQGDLHFSEVKAGKNVNKFSVCMPGLKPKSFYGEILGSPHFFRNSSYQTHHIRACKKGLSY